MARHKCRAQLESCGTCQAVPRKAHLSGWLPTPCFCAQHSQASGNDLQLKLEAAITALHLQSAHGGTSWPTVVAVSRLGRSRTRTW